jgi:hypothetical protein
VGGSIASRALSPSSFVEPGAIGMPLGELGTRGIPRDQLSKARPTIKGALPVNLIFTSVRLAQRVPVSVHIDETPPSVILAAGTTATVEIDDRTRGRIGALHPGGVENGLSSVFAALNDSSTEAERNFAAPNLKGCRVTARRRTCFPAGRANARMGGMSNRSPMTSI